MTSSNQQTILRKLILKAVANGWGNGQTLIDSNVPPTLSDIVFEVGFGRAFWGEEMIILRDIKTTRGQTISEEAWRFHQHIILDFIQLAREDLAYEYLEEFLDHD